MPGPENEPSSQERSTGVNLVLSFGVVIAVTVSLAVSVAAALCVSLLVEVLRTPGAGIG